MLFLFFLVTRYIATKGAIWNLVFSKTPLEAKSSCAPIFILFGMNVFSDFLNVHVIVPVEHILSEVIAFFDRSSQTCFPHLFDIKFMYTVITRDWLFKLVSIFESHSVHVHIVFYDASAAWVLCHKLNQFVQNTLKIGICLVRNQ